MLDVEADHEEDLIPLSTLVQGNNISVATTALRSVEENDNDIIEEPVAPQRFCVLLTLTKIRMSADLREVNTAKVNSLIRMVKKEEMKNMTQTSFKSCTMIGQTCRLDM